MEMNEKDTYIKDMEQGLLHTYNRVPIVLERGDGVYLYDTDGNKYLDCMAGIAVSGLGYGNQEFTGALKQQIDKLMHTSNLYYNTACGEAVQGLQRITGMDRIFFTNSGAEAMEGAIKAARKYAYARKTGRYELIAMQHSFHGRSLGTLSVTGTEAYRTPFEPLLPGVHFAVYNDLESVKALVNPKTCAIIMETVQGEGGVYPADPSFLEGVRKLCDEQGILLILDEIQCGMGRTGSMFAWQHYGVKPDIMAMAKAIANGFPVGAIAMTEQVAADSLAPGDHGTTYGGNPLACAAVAKVIEIFERENLIEHVQAMGAYLEKKLMELEASVECVKAHRGKGLMQGVVINKPVAEVIEAARKEGLLIISAGSDVIRLVPPLIISKEQIDELIIKLGKALA